MKAARLQPLIDMWYAPLYRFALIMSRDRDEAMELMQQIFARYAEKEHSLRDASQAKSSLFTALCRKFLDSGRQRRREATTEKDDFFERPVIEPAHSPHAVDASSALAGLRQLDKDLRAPLALFYLENHSYKEIAEIIDVPIDTVMARVSRGKEQLRCKLRAATRSVSRPAAIPADRDTAK